MEWDTIIQEQFIVLPIAASITALILFAHVSYRYIMRMHLKRQLYSKKINIYSGLPKDLLNQIASELDHVKGISCDPHLEHENLGPLSKHYYRIKALDKLHYLDRCLKKLEIPDLVMRPPRGDLKKYFKFLRNHSYNPLKGTDPAQTVHFSEIYEHARHNPKPFGEQDYQNYNEALNQICNSITRRYNKDNKKTYFDKSYIQTAHIRSGSLASSEVSDDQCRSPDTMACPEKTSSSSGSKNESCV